MKGDISFNLVHKKNHAVGLQWLRIFSTGTSNVYFLQPKLWQFSDLKK